MHGIVQDEAHLSPDVGLESVCSAFPFRQPLSSADVLAAIKKLMEKVARSVRSNGVRELPIAPDVPACSVR
eukprot:6141197-Pleurochrysis_carterae.AAC.1